MKIPFTSYEISKKVVDKMRKGRDLRKTNEIIQRIKKTQLIRVKEDIAKWRNALSQAESVLTPDRTELQRIFKDITLDLHLTSLIQTLILKTTSSPFYIANESGEIDEDLTKLFDKKWFRDVVKYIVEAPIYGYSLIQLNDIMGKEFTGSESVPREYIIPEKRAVKQHLRITMSDLTYFDDRPFDQWTIFVHEKYDMGLLNKAAPYVIKKNNALGAWSEAAEIFAMPLRTGKTDINNPKAYKNMETMLSEMGSAAWAVMDSEDEIDFVEISKTDYYQVYDKLTERMNSELSKGFLGQTMSSDDGSSRSQAEVHERLMEEYVSAFKMLVADVVNEQLIPLMARHGMISPKAKYIQDNEEKIDISTRFDMVDKISKWTGVKVPDDYVTETFGIPLEEVEAPDPIVEPVGDESESVIPTVTNLYKEIKEHKH